MNEIPELLVGRIFTRSEALAAGVTDKMLRGSRFVSLWPGCYHCASTPPAARDVVAAARERVPPDAVVSHTSGLRLRGLDLRPLRPIHFATNSGRHVRRHHVVVHRFQGSLEVEPVHGLLVASGRRTFVDCATILTLPELVAVGDWLVARKLTTPDGLRAYCDAVHFDGVQKGRVAADVVRSGAESVRESIARFHLVSHGLPEPAINLNIVSDAGEFLGRGDLPFPEWMVLAEYDGWYHERDAEQRQLDILRRERLEAHGWLLVILTSRDLAHPSRAVWRVYNALKARGYCGPLPRLDPRFGRWMPVSTLTNGR